MKRIILSLWFVCFSVVISSAQTHERTLKLTGIVSLPERTCALLEIKEAGRSSWRERVTLSKGQRADDVEVLRIDADEAVVEISDKGRKSSVKFERIEQQQEAQNEVRTARLAVQLHGANLRQVLDLYGEIKGCNVLQYPSLKDVQVSLNAETKTKTEAAVALEKMFKEQGMAVILDGKKFVIVVPTLSADTVVAGSDKIASEIELPNSASLPAADVLPAGPILFSPAEVAQVTTLYGYLVDRKLREDESLLWGPPIYFRTVTPLSKAEAAYAMETLLALDGLKVVFIGEKEFKIVSAVQPTEQRK